MIVLLLVTGAVYFFLQYLTPLSAPVLLAMLFVTIFGPMMKRMRYEATTSSSHRNGDYVITTTKHYDVRRAGTTQFMGCLLYTSRCV